MVNIHPPQYNRVQTIQERLWEGRGMLENRHCKLYDTEYVKVALWFARHSLNFVRQTRRAEKDNILCKYSVLKFEHSSLAVPWLALALRHIQQRKGRTRRGSRGMTLLRVSSSCRRLSVGVCFLFGFTREDKHDKSDSCVSLSPNWTSATASRKMHIFKVVTDFHPLKNRTQIKTQRGLVVFHKSKIFYQSK